MRCYNMEMKGGGGGPKICQAKSAQNLCLVFVGVLGGVGSNNCSEWPETYFGLGIFEIQQNFENCDIFCSNTQMDGL